MNEVNLYLPIIAMLSITALVWFYMYVMRLSYIVTHNIDAQDLHKPEQVAVLLPENINQAANNFKNLFELPVAFYVLTLLALTANLASTEIEYCAWLFVVFRAFHSVIHCSYNRVMHRFIAYMASAISLWAMLVLIIIQII